MACETGQSVHKKFKVAHSALTIAEGGAYLSVYERKLRVEAALNKERTALISRDQHLRACADCQRSPPR